MQNAIDNLYVLQYGLGLVFIGLICIIFICMITGYLCRKFAPDKAVEVKSEAVAQAEPASEQIPNKGEFVAAVCSAIAEELGTSISALRVHSIKKL